MKSFLTAIAAVALFAGVAHADETKSVNKTGDGHTVGATGAMANASKDGVATDPEQVKAQSGNMTKASPGTVGAAPMANAPSSNPSH